MIEGLKWGAIVGALLYLVEQLLGALSVVLRGGGSPSVTDRPILLVPICLALFLLLFACSAAGFYTGRETGRAGLGAVAGMATLVVQYVLGRIYTVGAAATSAGAAQGSGSALNPVAQFFAMALAAVLFLGLGASMGWLGGRPGAQQARRAQAGGEAEDGRVIPEPPA